MENRQTHPSVFHPFELRTRRGKLRLTTNDDGDKLFAKLERGAIVKLQDNSSLLGAKW